MFHHSAFMKPDAIKKFIRKLTSEKVMLWCVRVLDAYLILSGEGLMIEKCMKKHCDPISRPGEVRQKKLMGRVSQYRNCFVMKGRFVNDVLKLVLTAFNKHLFKLSTRLKINNKLIKSCTNL